VLWCNNARLIAENISFKIKDYIHILTSTNGGGLGGDHGCHHEPSLGEYYKELCFYRDLNGNIFILLFV